MRILCAPTQGLKWVIQNNVGTKKTDLFLKNHAVHREILHFYSDGVHVFYGKVSVPIIFHLTMGTKT